MEKKLIVILAALVTSMFLAIRSYAEDNVSDPKVGIISGRVLDQSTNQPMEYVNVSVFNSADSVLITGTISNPDGQFKIEKIATGDYYLRISFMGFSDLLTEKISVNTKSQHNYLGEIKLKVSAAEIGENS